MKLIKTKQYEKDVKKKLKDKHKNAEIEKLSKIENLILDSENLKILLHNPLRIIFGIEKKTGDLKEIYTANLNSKLRLYMKPISEYPYDEAKIIEIELIKIDDKHYGDG